MPRPRQTDRELHAAIGDRLKRARTLRNLSQEQLAEALGVQPETLSRYETASIPVSITVLFQLAHALDITAGALLAIPETPDEAEAELVERWSLLDADGRELVLGLLRRLSP